MIRCVNKCKEIVPIFSEWNVDGVILLGANKEEAPDIEDHLFVPTMYIDTYAEELDIANIGIDDYKGGFLAAKYLLDKGHRNIAFVGPNVERSDVIQSRFRGFCDACKERKVEITSEHIIEVMTTYEQGVDAGKWVAISNQGFTAVVTMSDVLAFGVMEGIRVRGKNVPEDVSVVGFDNLPSCRYSNPQLTTVSQNLEQKAFMAGECLFQMIRNKEKRVVNQRVDVEIVERQSVKEI